MMETQTHILGSQKKAAVSGSDTICCLSSSHNYNKEKSEAEISLEWKLIMIVFLPKRLKIMHCHGGSFSIGWFISFTCTSQILV